MQTIEINGVKFNDFGTNNYSCGMRLISLYPMPKGMVKDVLRGEYPNVYLNPSAPCTSEFFGVYGTSEQYKEFYENQRDSCIAAQLVERINWNFNHPQYREIKTEVENSYRDWWDK